jgi:hypothetical protein
LYVEHWVRLCNAVIEPKNRSKTKRFHLSVMACLCLVTEQFDISGEILQFFGRYFFAIIMVEVNILHFYNTPLRLYFLVFNEFYCVRIILGLS